MRHEADMRWEIVVPVKHGMEALMLALNEAEINTETITVHIHQGRTETQQLKDTNDTPTVMLHSGKINETTTLCIPTEEEWRHATSEDHDLVYIKRILSSLEETRIDPK